MDCLYVLVPLVVAIDEQFMLFINTYSSYMFKYIYIYFNILKFYIIFHIYQIHHPNHHIYYL